MSRTGKVLLEKEILLESGTNELEILVFRVHDFCFAINVAKVREVLPRMRMAALPKASPAVKGVFQLRDRVIPCVSLAEHLQIEGSDPEQMMILTDFNQQQTAFLVHGVERIHRMSWQDILPLPGLQDFSGTPVTALARRGDRLIAMLDFEMIHDCLTNHRNSSAVVSNDAGFPRGAAKVLVVDDSCTVREALRQTLAASGYTSLQVFENGEEAWKWLEAQAQTHRTLASFADLLVSDVEMPRVDGFHLTRRVKEHPLLSTLPVLLYSSIVTPDNRKKGEAVGADAQLSKPELARVVEMADSLIQASRAKADKGESTPRPAKPAEVCTNTAPATLRTDASIASGSAPAAARNVVEPTTPAPLDSLRPCPTAAPKFEEVAAAEQEPADIPAEQSAEDCCDMNETVSDHEQSAPPKTASPTGSDSPCEELAKAARDTEPAKTSKTKRTAPKTSATQRTTSEPAAPTPSQDCDNSDFTPHVESGIEGGAMDLYAVFRDELLERSAELSMLLAEAELRGISPAHTNRLRRSLHTIKSAAMVVPVDEISRTTHLLESLIDASVAAADSWAWPSLESFADWLRQVAAEPDRNSDLLNRSVPLQAEIVEEISKYV